VPNLLTRPIKEVRAVTGRWTVTIAVLFVFCSLVGAQDAMPFLKSLSEKWDKTQTFRMKATITMTMKGEGMEMKMSMPMEMTFQKPNKFRMTMEMANPADPKGAKIKQVVVSDGKHMFIEMAPMKQTMKMPMPEKGKMPPGMGSGMPGMDPMGLGSAFTKERLKTIKSAKFVGKEKIGGRLCRIMRLVTQDGLAMDFWMDGETPRQIKVEMTGLQFGGMPKGPGPSPVGKGGSMTVVMTMHEFVRDPKLPANFFAYSPPPGFTVVEAPQPGVPGPAPGPGGPAPVPPPGSPPAPPGQ
ncbi:MAG: DUF2092 domain-containing protein, partial [Armatimonadetes bacterium]|nr:DUF2092 domain-containing protein [Armatimonadota bacterium]MDW8121132.1 DUF2092 domain-containing protein [Armatimonadota bacterium]